jgi:hypothetical protein
MPIPAPADGFDHDGVSNPFGVGASLDDGAGIVDRQRIVETRHRRHTRSERHPAGHHLVAESVEHIGGRTDEYDTGLEDRPGKGALLAEKAVARMNRLGARRPGSRDDGFDREVAFSHGGRADTDGLVGHLDVHRVDIRVGMDRHRPNAELPARAQNAARDFPAVGHQYLAEHR